MRCFAWCLMAACAFTLGCNQPVETIPTVAPVTSGTTVDGDHDHDEGDHDHAEDADHEHAEGEMHEHADGAEHEHAEGEHAEGAETAAPEESEAAPAPAGDETSSTKEIIRFVADKKISVPSMMCPYSCWPTVQETLAKQPGVEGVQLAEQPEGTKEGEIVERVVELKLNGDFDADAAVAALAKVNFKAEVAN